MSVLVSRIRRGPAKPYASIPRIDWSHPLAAGLTFYVYNAGGRYVDLVNGLTGVLQSSTTNPTVVMNKFGGGYKFAGSAGASGSISLAPTSGAPAYTNFCGTLPYSFVAGTVFTAANSFTTISGIANTTSTDNAETTGIAFWALNGTTTPVIIFDAGGTQVPYTGSIVADFQTWGCVAKTTTTADLYRSGVLDKNATGISATNHSVGSFSKIGAFAVNGSTATGPTDSGGLATGGNNGFLPFFAAWNRALSAADFLQVHQDPYGFLIYPEEEYEPPFIELVGIVASATPLFPRQSFFDVVPPLKVASGFREFMQGPFSGTSPALTNPLQTVPFFDQTQKIKIPERLVESPPKTTPYSYITQNYFDQTSKLKLPERLQEAPPGTSPSLTNPLRTVQFFDKNERVKTPDRFVEAPPGTSPNITAPYITSNLFDAAKLLKPLERLQEAFGVQFPTPQVLAAWFEQVKPKSIPIDNTPALFQPSAAVVVSTIVEQSFFDTVKLKQSNDFAQGPFAGTSPAISSTYITQAFFDQVRLKQPIIDKPSDMAPLVVAVNLSAANWFDAVRLLKVPDRFGELYPQQYWTPENFDQWFDQLKLLKVPDRLQEAFGAPFPPGQSLTAWFDQIKKLKVPEDFPFTATGATQPVTIQNALTDWFEAVKLKQPIVETPLVVFFPAQNIVVTPELHDFQFIANVGKLMGH